MKTLITEPRIYKKEYLKDLWEYEISIEDIHEKNILEMTNEAEILLISLDTKIDKNVINYFNNLKYIITPTTGTDHINVDYCKEKGVEIISLKNETEFLQNIPPTAEFTFGLIFSVLRNIPHAFESVKSFEWKREKFVGNELMGKTLGILGFGRLGRIVAEYAKAFKMHVIAYDPSEEAINAMKQQDVLYRFWDDVFKLSDIVSIHIGLSNETYGIVGRKELEMMKKEAILINTSRGQIIIEEELLTVLEEKKIKGAGLDVLGTENQKEHPQINKLIAYSRKNDNLIITPHIAGTTQESIKKTVEFVIQKYLKLQSANLSVIK